MVNAIVFFFQNKSAGNAVKALKKLAFNARMLKGGKW